jgi:hypothetical protein
MTCEAAVPMTAPTMINSSAVTRARVILAFSRLVDWDHTLCRCHSKAMADAGSVMHVSSLAPRQRVKPGARMPGCLGCLAVTARRVRLFVSHSSPPGAGTDRLAAFVATLTSGEDAVDVLYDREYITVGDRWRERINAMLAECDAAAVLLTPEALTSPWVLKEATILAWRAEQNARFPLLPIAWTGVTRKDVRNSNLWSPLDLPGIQMLSVDDPAAAARQVKAVLAPHRTTRLRAPLDVLAADLSVLLAKASTEQCTWLWDQLSGDRPEEIDEEKSALARAIARWMLCQPPPALERIARALMHLGEVFPLDDAYQIIDLIAPLWVEMDAAAWFASTRVDQRDLAIRCRQPGQVLTHYMRMAYLPARSPRVFLLNGITAGPHADDVAVELRKVLGPLLERSAGRKLHDAEIDAKLNTVKERPYVALPLPADQSVIEELRRRFSRVTFVYFAAYEDAGNAPGMQWVVPQLDPDLEEAVCQDLEDARFVLNTRGSPW